jgi:hypothetical protein
MYTEFWLRKTSEKRDRKDQKWKGQNKFKLDCGDGNWIKLADSRV